MDVYRGIHGFMVDMSLHNASKVTINRPCFDGLCKPPILFTNITMNAGYKPTYNRCAPDCTMNNCAIVALD